MLKKIFYRLTEALDIIRDNGIKYFLNRYIYFNKIWVVVEKDLIDFEMKASTELEELFFTEINQDNFTKEILTEQEENHFYRIKSYLAKGYHGYLLQGYDGLVGYIWYAPILRDAGNNHPDVKYIRITHEEPSVYMFSMYLRPIQRGRNMGVFIYSSLLQLLKNKGFAKGYAIYDTKNIPALWVNRMLRFKEIRRLTINQIIFYKFVANKQIEERSVG